MKTNEEFIETNPLHQLSDKITRNMYTTDLVAENLSYALSPILSLSSSRQCCWSHSAKVHADAEHLLRTAQITVGIMLVRYLTHRLFGTLVQLELHLIDITALRIPEKRCMPIWKQYKLNNLMTPFSQRYKRLTTYFARCQPDDEIKIRNNNNSQ